MQEYVFWFYVTGETNGIRGEDMELVLVGKQYELYKPVKPLGQTKKMQKTKNQSLEKLVADINQRMASANMAEGAQGLEAVKSGLWQIEKEKSLEESFWEMVNSGRASGTGDGSVGGFLQQMKDTYSFLTNMKEYANVIGKYEELSGDMEQPEEERQFYQDALESLKKGFEEEFASGLGWIQTFNMSRLSSEELRKNLGLDSFKGLDSKQIMKKLDGAQDFLKRAGFEQGKTNQIGRCWRESRFFEQDYTIHLEGFKEYGFKAIRDFNDPIHEKDDIYLKGTLYVSNLNEYHQLDTRA